MKRVDGKDIEQDVNDLMQGKSSYQTDGSAIRDCKLQEKSYRLVEGNDVVAIGGERMEVEPPPVPTYRNDSG